MSDFGDLSGITFNLRTNRLVCGHQRVDLLREKHGDLELIEERGRMFIQLPNGDEFPVRVVDWPEDKERIANVVANNPEIAGVFKPEAVEAMLAGIDAQQKAAYRVDVMLNNLKLPSDFVDNVESGDRLTGSGEGVKLPPDLEDAPEGEEREERDGYPVYFMLSRDEYKVFKIATAGQDKEAWFRRVLQMAEARRL